MTHSLTRFRSLRISVSFACINSGFVSRDDLNVQRTALPTRRTLDDTQSDGPHVHIISALRRPTVPANVYVRKCFWVVGIHFDPSRFGDSSVGAADCIATPVNFRTLTLRPSGEVCPHSREQFSLEHRLRPEDPQGTLFPVQVNRTGSLRSREGDLLQTPLERLEMKKERRTHSC